MGALPKRVKIVEVGPRDGLQNEKVRREGRPEGRSCLCLAHPGSWARSIMDFVSLEYYTEVNII